MKKVALVLMFVIFCSMISFAGFVSADPAKVAYVYKKTFSVNQDVIDVFNELGLEVELVRDSDVRRTDFSQYKIIFVGDERFRNKKYIPVFEYPSIIANYYHGYEFGLTDQDGVSQIASTSPLSVKTENKVVQVYTQAFFDPLVTVAIPYYYLSDLNRAPGFRKVASTYHGDDYDLGAVIAYADANTQLLNNYFAQEKMCFFGIIESEFWTPAAKQFFKDCTTFVAITCYTDEDCDDNNPSSIDTCVNPGTVDSYCKHDEITCFEDADCGQDGFVGDPYCVGSDVYQDYKDFTCENPGTFDSSCSYEIYEKFKKTCLRGCENGICVDEHDIGILVGGDYVDGVKLLDNADNVILQDPAILQENGKYRIKFKIINLGSFDEEVEYAVAIMQGSSIIHEFSVGTMTLDSGETSTDRTRTWDIDVPKGEYDIVVAVNIVGFQDDNPADNVVARHIRVGEEVGECQDILVIKPGINHVSLKCEYEENDVQSLFANKLSGGAGAVNADVIWKLKPGEYPESKKSGLSYEATWQIDWDDPTGDWDDWQGKWWNEKTGDFSEMQFGVGEGFLIENRHDEKTITLNGQDPGQIHYNFVKGFNMFGVPVEMKASEFLELVPECSTISSWDPDQEYWDKYAGYTLPGGGKYWTYYPESSKYSTEYTKEYDINDDCTVDVHDVIAVSACARGKTVYLATCDLNSDGNINQDDMLILLEKAGSTDRKTLTRYDIDGNGEINDYDALAIFTCSQGGCDLNNDGKIDDDDEDIILFNQQYNIENFDLKVNEAYLLECDEATSLAL